MQKSFTFVLFGATGDLAQRKILPALLKLFEQGIFTGDSQIICFSRRPWNDEQYYQFILPILSGDHAIQFLEIVSYVQGAFDDRESFKNLRAKIKNETVFYHLAIQPEFYATTIENLGQAGHRGTLLIEKPFGHDLDSALALEKQIEKYFPTADVFLIDHYLGKEGLLELLESRKNNTALEEQLSKEFIQSIHVRLLESIDINGRGEFYDTVGALRDVGQNHMLVMLTTLLGDTNKPIGVARALALAELEPVLPEKISRGQYDGYKTEVVNDLSETETYFKFSTFSHNERFEGIEIILEGGKALAKKKSDIIVLLKDGSKIIFDMEKPKNRDAYEIILEAALVGKRDFFVSFSEMKEAWKLISPVLIIFPKIPLQIYKKGEYL